jgi:hypothetical protein
METVRYRGSQHHEDNLHPSLIKEWRQSGKGLSDMRIASTLLSSKNGDSQYNIQLWTGEKCLVATSRNATAIRR